MPLQYQWVCYLIVDLLHGIRLEKVFVTNANKLLPIARFVVQFTHVCSMVLINFTLFSNTFETCPDVRSLYAGSFCIKT